MTVLQDAVETQHMCLKGRRLGASRFCQDSSSQNVCQFNVHVGPDWRLLSWALTTNRPRNAHQPHPAFRCYPLLGFVMSMTKPGCRLSNSSSCIGRNQHAEHTGEYIVLAAYLAVCCLSVAAPHPYPLNDGSSSTSTCFHALW
jgi:hypothetical protein